MSKVLVIIKSMGIGDLCIHISSIHAISKKISKSVTILAQKNTRAQSILKHDPHIEEVIELDKKEIKGFFNVIKKIKSKHFDQSYIYSDSIRLYLIAKLSGIREIFHYNFFSKKGKNFCRTIKEFTEKILDTEIDYQSKIYCDNNEIEEAEKKFNISDKTKNIVCGISSSGPTTRWDVNNYIKLFESLNSRFQCKFFLAGGLNDEGLIKKVISSSIGNRCVSFSAMKIDETISIISTCQYYIGNDTAWGHISSALGLKSFVLYMDTPPLAYGSYIKNLSAILPDGETMESCGHNTRGKNRIPVNKVLSKILEFIN